jgi:GAF domain-containing protein
VPIPQPDELGRLATSFNRMTRELQAYVQALTASRDQLRGNLAILGETLSSTHDVDRILQVILRTALAATGARAGLVLLIDPVAGQLVAQCGVGLTGAWDVPDAELPERRLPVGSGVLGAVAAAGEPRRGHGQVGSTEPPCLTYLAVPICAPVTADEPLLPGDPPAAAGPATLGVLALYDRVGGGAFDDADLQTLRTFAGQAGVAVHNVRVHEEAQRLSLTDPLTGLWNYRYLRESLRREQPHPGERAPERGDAEDLRGGCADRGAHDDRRHLRHELRAHAGARLELRIPGGAGGDGRDLRRAVRLFQAHRMALGFRADDHRSRLHLLQDRRGRHPVAQARRG